MSVAAQANAAVAATGPLGRLLSAIQRMQETRARRVIYHQTVRELNALTARDLHDLGINRSMIPALAREAAFGPN